MQIGGQILNFNFHFERELEEMERATNEREEQDDGASELAAWARINLRIIHHRNVKRLYKSWLCSSRNPHTVERPDLAHLIIEHGGFNDMYTDSAYNLTCTSTMQEATAERDKRHRNSVKRKVCGGVILEEN